MTIKGIAHEQGWTLVQTDDEKQPQICIPTRYFPWGVEQGHRVVACEKHDTWSFFNDTSLTGMVNRSLCK